LKGEINLHSADSVEIISVMDNSLDLLIAGAENVHRYKYLDPTNPFTQLLPIAEHGFSAIIDIKSGKQVRRLLFDTGVSKNGILQNMKAMNIDPKSIDAIVLSHGHTDHAMGILGFLETSGRKGLPFVIHPDAYLPRKLILPTGDELNIPAPNRRELLDKEIELIESAGPSMLFDRTSLVSGEVSRTTEFETGFPIHWAKRNNEWVLDPIISDDQCIIVNVRNKGLVIITGCGHAGIINIIRNAIALTGVDIIFFVMGGFHLTGAIFEPSIEPTIQELKKINPSIIVPGHCTGYKATHRIAAELPNSFVQNSVGTKFVI
jgi:7,8-dihydropterin-6-yl-methyl-4-(beta-D-ribofuranosyl)aminobenzene 5'-phosphate synthase